MHNPPHPGESLKMLYMEPLGLTIQALAERLGVERKAISRIVNQHGGVSADMAIRLSKAFNTSPELWLNKQRGYDLWHAKQRLKKEAARIKPFQYASMEESRPGC